MSRLASTQPLTTLSTRRIPTVSRRGLNLDSTFGRFDVGVIGFESLARYDAIDIYSQHVVPYDIREQEEGESEGRTDR